MSKASKYLVRTAKLDRASALRIVHPLNPKSEVFMHALSDKVGMARVHLNLARVLPGKESFIHHSHALQEEFVFILGGAGRALIGDDEIDVGPGDYLGFPTDGTPHHLVNSGERDLVYLMGGERTDVEVARFPGVGKVAVMRSGKVTLFDEAAGEEKSVEDWVKD